MNVSLALLIVLVSAAAYTDLKKHQIPNWLTASGTCCGLLAGFVRDGTDGLVPALAGSAAGFGIMLLLHVIGAVGAGDVKLFGAIGAVSGPWLVLSVAVYSVLFAGVIGLIILLLKKQLVSRGAPILYAVFGFLCLRQWDGLEVYRNPKERLRFPFLLAVVPGLAAALWETSL